MGLIGIFKFRRRYQRADFRLFAVSSFSALIATNAPVSVDHRQQIVRSAATYRASQSEVIHAASKGAAALLVSFLNSCLEERSCTVYAISPGAIK